jgi:hypothetical protein
MKTTIFAIALCAFATSAVAADDVFPRRFAPNQFDQVTELVESKMADGAPYAATEEERVEVRRLLGEIGTLVAGKARLSELDSDARAGVDQRRKQINELLGDNKDQVAATEAPRKRRGALDMRDARPAPGSD